MSPGLRGSFEAREAVARPVPASFAGPGLERLGQGDAPPLAEAALFAYWPLTPGDGSAVRARLDSGDPWIVARSTRLGRAVVVAAPLDARGGTVAVNPDFVPLVHELTLDLASGVAAVASRPGEPVRFELGRSEAIGTVLEAEVLEVTGPDGTTAGTAKVERAGGRAWAQLDTAAGPGLYRARGEVGGGRAPITSYGVVLADPSAWDATLLSEPDREALREAGGAIFGATPDALLTGGGGPGGGGGCASSMAWVDPGRARRARPGGRADASSVAVPRRRGGVTPLPCPFRSQAGRRRARRRRALRSPRPSVTIA